MNLGTSAAFILLLSVLVAWGILRVVAPSVEQKSRTALLAAASVLVGVLLAVLSLGMYKKRTPQKPSQEVVDPKIILEETEARFETTDTFEELERDADNLLPPPPPGDSLSDELAEFRAGSADLLGDGPGHDLPD